MASYDFTPDARSPGEDLSYSGVGSRIRRFMMDEVLDRESAHIKTLTLGNLYHYFMDMHLYIPECDTCLVVISRRQDGLYEVTQALLDGSGQLIYEQRDTVKGRRLLARELAADVVAFLDGRDSRVMKMPE